MDRSGVLWDADVPVRLCARSSETSGDFNMVSEGRLILEKLSNPIANVIVKTVRPELRALVRSGGRSYASVVPCMGAEVGYVFVRRDRSQKLQAGNADLSHRMERRGLILTRYQNYVMIRKKI